MLEDEVMSWGEVQERLVEAVLAWRRMPDREGGWLAVRAYWPDVLREVGHGADGDFDARAAMPRLPLTRGEVAAMEEASGWLAAVPERDRRLVGLALGKLADGHAQVPWLELRGAMGVTLGAGGLARRYERAIGAVCRFVNARTC